MLCTYLLALADILMAVDLRQFAPLVGDAKGEQAEAVLVHMESPDYLVIWIPWA